MLPERNNDSYSQWTSLSSVFFLLLYVYVGGSSAPKQGGSSFHGAILVLLICVCMQPSLAQYVDDYDGFAEETTTMEDTTLEGNCP